MTSPRTVPRAVSARSVVSGAVLIACLLTACAPVDTVPAASSPTASLPAPRSTFTPPPPTRPTTAVAPLRGSVIPIEAAQRPAVSAKIDNHWDARPQWGIDRADVVVEELVEGGLTRYLAVWQSDLPDQVGPVRSIRPMDPDIVSPFGGIIAYSGGRARFVEMMQEAPVHNAIHGGADDRFMFRTTERRAPHNVILRAPQIAAEYSDLDAPAAQFRYSSSGWAPLFGEESVGLDLRFSAVSPRSWRWDARSGAYLRSQDGRPDTAAGGGRISAANVLVLRVAIDDRYGDVPKTVLVGTGTGVLSSGGSALPVTWTKASRDAPIVLRNAAGSEVQLAEGNTWIELVPEAGSVAVL